MMPTTTRPRPRLFTIGHSVHAWPTFLSLLACHEIEMLADVRSQPYSRFHPHFRRAAMAAALKDAGIEYVFLGRELGARRTERESYRGLQARYDLVRQLPVFKMGLDRLRAGVVSQRIALMCAEKDPLTCHRTILVCRQLRADPIDVVHILEDGSLETGAEAETRLLGLVGLPQDDLFRDRRDLIEEAYDRQSDRIAFKATTKAELDRLCRSSAAR